MMHGFARRLPDLRPGVAFLEVLASIALCGMLLAALGSMASGLARSAREVERHHRWDACAEAMLRAIHDEIAVGWRPEVTDPGVGARVRADADHLRITVRSERVGEERVVVYRGVGSGVNGELGIERLEVSGGSLSSASLVLGDVQMMQWRIEGSVLEVKVHSRSGGVRLRRYQLDRGGEA